MALERLKLAAAWLALACAAPALAHGPLHLVCPRAKLGGVKVDGDIEGWKDSRFVEVDHSHAAFGEAKSDADASFRFAALWDERYLYIAVEVTDNSIVPAPTLARLYEGDCVEICLDVNNDSEGGYDAGDFQFVICPTGPQRIPRVSLYRNPVLRIEDAPFVRVAANITTTGYVVEAAFSWKELGVKPEAGHVVGLSVDVRDYDADGSAKGLTWVPASDPSANPLRWGDLVLVAKATDDAAPVLEGLREKNARWQRLLDGTAREADNDVTVEVAWASVGTLSQGIGWNVQFRDGRFPKWDEAGWQAFLELLAWTRPAWIRYGVNLGQWEPANDDPDPSHANWPGFAFRSQAMRQHYRVLDLCQARGIHVLWANWCIGDRATGVRWLAETVHNPALADTDGDPYSDAPYDPEELAESLAACLYHLRLVRNYTCVDGVSLWNEPNESWSYNSPSAKYPEAFWTYYDALARHLRRLGLRQAVRIVGPEASIASYEALPALARDLRLYSPEVDILAHHDYLGYADYHRIDRGAPLSFAAKPYEQLHRAARRPVAVTELGNMGNGASEVGGDAAVYAGSLSTCRLILDGLNHGVAGFLRWEFKPYGVSWQNFGALTTLTQRHVFEPYRPVFFPHALLCHAALRGSQALRTAVGGGLDENRVPRVACAALNDPQSGATILLLLNDGFQPKRVTLAFDRRMLRRSLRFGHLSYDASLPEAFQKQPEVVAAGGRATLTLGPRSLHALSTRAGFADVPPLPKLPPRDEPKYTSAAADGVATHTAFMAFDADYDWRVWQSTSGQTTLQTEPEQGKPANRVCRVAYDFVGVKAGGRPEHVVAHTDLLIDGKPQSVAFWLRGDGQGHKLAFLLLDAKGEVFEYPTPTAIAWKGWKKLDFAVADFPEGWNHWSGDGVPDYPLRGFGLTLTAPDAAYRGRGILEIDEVQVVSQTR